MPPTETFFYRTAKGQAPVLEWLRELRGRDPKAYAKCLVKIERLADLGHELRRPEADLLRDGIYELRVRRGRVNYRILYFFHGRNVAILAHALVKEREVPVADLERALKRKQKLEADPEKHIHPG